MVNTYIGYVLLLCMVALSYTELSLIRNCSISHTYS